MKIARHMDACAPRVLPDGWELREDYANARVYWRHGVNPLSVIAEVAEYGGRHWLHVSCSARVRLPSWAELREVKDLFCGREALALQVLPPASEYVNIDPNVLHLWVALEGPRPCPDFTRGLKAI